MTRGRDGVIARIRQLAGRLPDSQPHPRLAHPDDHTRARPADAAADDPLTALEVRMTHLERLVEGLQDSVHRESERQLKLITELQTRVSPGAMGASLAEDARKRGL